MAKPSDPTASTVGLPAAPHKRPAAGSSRPRQVEADSGELTLGQGERYEELASLGCGGMGEVVLCRDRWVGREVARKVISPGRGSESDTRARFLREARIQGQIEHPCVVPVYDLGIGPEGVPFFTMKRVRGVTLRDVLHGLSQRDPQVVERWSPRKLLGAFAQLALAIGYAHERGVVHRDLKPSNVMLGDFGEVYVIDWGVAKAVGTSELPASVPRKIAPEPISPDVDSTPSEPTADGAILGTPGYMAPEQIGLLGRPTDPRADVYALGAMLFEIVTLEPLHDRTTSEEAVLSTLRGVEARPSIRAPDRDAPPELDAICARATASEPADRHPDGRGLAAELERVLEGDRDLTLRREMSLRHAQAAQDDSERALAGGPGAIEARAAAMRELGRALALDPDNDAALASVARLMMTPPAEVPPEAEVALAEAATSAERLGARMSLGAYVVCIGFGLAMLALDVEPWLLVSYLAAMVLAMGVTAVGAFGRRPHVATMYAAMLACCGGFALLSRLCGPFVLVPGAMCASTVLFALMPRRGVSLSAVVLGCAGVVVPAALEWTGVVSASYAFRDGVLEVLPTAATLHPVPTIVFLVVGSLASIVVPGVMCAHTRAALMAAERRIRLHAWHLDRMSPRAASVARPG